MRDFIKEKKGTIGLILVVLSFFFIAVFLFTKAGRTPDRIINVWEKDAAEIVSRDTYKEFKDAADAYKLNNEADPATRHMRAFIEEKKKKSKDKDKKDVEDHGRNIAEVLPFDAATLKQLNLKKLYTSVEDGPEREALMRIIQDVEHPLTQQQLKALSEFFKAQENTISETEKDDIRKIVKVITSDNGIRAKQAMLKQQATGWISNFINTLLGHTANLIFSFKNYMPDSFREYFEDASDWLVGTFVVRRITNILRMAAFAEPTSKIIGWLINLKPEYEAFLKGEWFIKDENEAYTQGEGFDKFKKYFATKSGKDSILLKIIFIAIYDLKGIRKALKNRNTKSFLLGCAVVLAMIAVFMYMTRTYNIVYWTLLVSLVLYLINLWFWLRSPFYNETTVHKMFGKDTGATFLTKLAYFFDHLKTLGRIRLLVFCAALFDAVQSLYFSWRSAHASAIFFNRLRRIHTKMQKVNDAYSKQNKKAPYFKEIAVFMNDKRTPAYRLVSQKPLENHVREFMSSLGYMVFGTDYHGLDKVLKDQKYKKALASFLVLYKMTNQLGSEKDYTLLQEASQDDAERSNPCIHIKGLRPFVAEKKDDKSSLCHDVNIGRKSRSYLLVGDDESVMKDYLACIAENVIYTQNMGVIRGKNKHYIACDKLFYADGYQDSREAHTTRLEKIMRYATQHSDEKILVLVSNIAGKISGAEHAAFVHSYASELKKLANVTFVFSTCNVQHMYEVIDMEKTSFALQTPLLKDKKPTGTITIGRAAGHVQNIKMSPKVAKKFRILLKKNPNYKGHLQDHVPKDYSSSILFLLIMIFMVLGLMLFRKRAK